MILSDQDRGRTVDVNVGSVITLRLKENPTTGYRWVVGTSPGLEQAGDRFEAGSAAGAAGMRELQFRAVQVGTHDLRLENRRVWEGEGSAVDRFEVRVIVK